MLTPSRQSDKVYQMPEQEKTVGVNIEFAAVGGDVMMVVGSTEVWWSVDQLAEFLDLGTQCLGDAIEQLGGKVTL